MRRVLSFLSSADLGLVIGAEPVIKVPKRKIRAGLPGHFPTRKGTLHGLRTKDLLMMDALGHFEVNPDIVLMATYAHTLFWWERQPDGTLIQRKYVPTLTLKRRDGSVVVLDVRSSEEAEDPKWLRTSAFIRNDYWVDHSVEFSTLTELSVRVEPRHSNVARILQSRMIVADNAALSRVRSIIHSFPLPTTVGLVAERAALPNPHGRGDRSFSCLCELAIAGEIAFDMSEPLGPETRVSGGCLEPAHARGSAA